MPFVKRKYIQISGLVLGLFLILGLLGVWYIEPIVTKYLNDNAADYLNAKSDDLYVYEIGKIKLDVWKGGLHVEYFKVKPKDSTKVLFQNGTLKNIITIESGLVKLKGLDLFDLYRNENINLDQIKLEAPKVYYRDNSEAGKEVRSLREIIKDMGHVITVGKINFDNVYFEMGKGVDTSENAIRIDSLNFVVQKLHISSETAEKELPFEVEDIFVESERINYKLDNSVQLFLENPHFSFIQRSLSCGKLQLRSKGTTTFEMDSTFLKGIDFVSFIDSNKINVELSQFYHPIISFKKSSTGNKINFSSLFTVPVEFGELKAFDGELHLFDKDKIGGREKVKISSLDLELSGLSNTLSDLLGGKKIQLDFLKFRCNPKFTFRNNKSGATKSMSLEDFELDIVGVYTDSILFNSESILASQYFGFDFEKLRYDVSNTSRIEISEFDIDVKNNKVHIGRGSVHTFSNQKSKNTLKFFVDDIEVDGIDLKSILIDGEVNLKHVVADGVHIDYDQWKRESKDFKDEIDLEYYMGVPLVISSLELKNTDLHLKRYLNDNEVQKIKITDVEIQIKELNNHENRGNDLLAIGLEKLKVSGDPKILFIDSLDKIDRVLLMDNIALELHHVYTNDTIINTSLPIRVDDYTVDFGGLIYNLDEYYTLKVGEVHFNKLRKVLSFDAISVRSRYKKREHVEKFGVQTEWIDLDVKSVDVLGFNLKEILLEEKAIVERLSINKPKLKLFRDKNYKRVSDKEKPLPVSALLSFPFSMRLAHIDVNNMELLYEEIPEDKTEVGAISFKKLNCRASNITNDKDDIKGNSKMILNINTDFMGEIPLKAKYTFDLRSANKPFTLEGNVAPFRMNIMDDAMLKLVGIGIQSGQVNWIKFWLEGDNDKSNGWFDMHYENFRVKSGFKRDDKIFGVRKNWLLTGAANAIIIPQNTNVRKFRRGIISTARMKDRSIFNYSWHSLKSGIMSSFGVRRYTKIELE